MQIYENHTSAWVFSRTFAAYLQNTFGGLLLNIDKYPQTHEI